MPVSPLEEHLDSRRGLNPWLQNVSDDEAAAMWYAACLASLRLHLAAFDAVIFYEDLVSDPVGTVAGLFRVMGVDEGHIPLGLGAMERNSQEGIVAMRRRLAQ